MSANDSGSVDPEKAVSLAEAYLDRHRQELSADRERAYEAKIERWEERKKELDEDDPLYQVAKERIQEAKEPLERAKTSSEDIERRLIEVAAEGFLAEGKWLDTRLLRALNLILFDKYSDSLVVDRNIIEEGAEFDDDELYAVSRAVRKLAADELDSL